MDEELQTGGTKQTHLKWFGIPRLIPFLRPHRRLFFLLFAFGLAASATEILFPLFQRYAIDHYIAKGTLDTLPVFILLYVLVLAVAAVSGYLSAYGSCALELRVAHDMRKTCFRPGISAVALPRATFISASAPPRWTWPCGTPSGASARRT